MENVLGEFCIFLCNKFTGCGHKDWMELMFAPPVSDSPAIKMLHLLLVLLCHDAKWGCLWWFYGDPTSRFMNLDDLTQMR